MESIVDPKLSTIAPKVVAYHGKVMEIPFLVSNQAKIAQKIVLAQSKDFQLVL